MGDFPVADLVCMRPQVLMVRFCSLFDPKERTVTFLNGQTYSLASLRALGMGSLLDAMFEFSEKLGSLGLEPDEMALFMAVVLVSAGKNYTLTYIHNSRPSVGKFPELNANFPSLSPDRSGIVAYLPISPLLPLRFPSPWPCSCILPLFKYPELISVIRSVCACVCVCVRGCKMGVGLLPSHLTICSEV